MASSLDGKVSIITGSGSGIGRATAELFAAEGAKVVVADIDEAAGRQTVETVKAAGGEALFLRADVSKSADVRALVADVRQALGRIDVLHNNAGVGKMRADLEAVSEDEWCWMLDVNLTSMFLLTQAVIPTMREQGGGVIVNTASVGGLQGVPNGVAYATSKHGVVGLTRSTAPALAELRIRVNAVCPAGVDTPLVDHEAGQASMIARTVGWLQPVDIARAVRFLAVRDDLNGALIDVRRVDGEARYFLVNDWSDEPIEGVV